MRLGNRKLDFASTVIIILAFACLAGTAFCFWMIRSGGQADSSSIAISELSDGAEVNDVTSTRGEFQTPGDIPAVEDRRRSMTNPTVLEEEASHIRIKSGLSEDTKVSPIPVSPRNSRCGSIKRIIVHRTFVGNGAVSWGA